MTRRGLLGAAVVGGPVAVMAGCAAPAPQTPVTSTAPDAATGASGDRRTRTLLAYFSRAGENYFNGGRIDLDIGNTAVAARIVAEIVDVDLFEIRARDPYPDDYDETVARNVREQDAEARPAIADALPDLGRYDTVILASGLWNVRVPRIMRTFTDAADLAAKTLLPLVTYAVSGIGRAEEEYRQACPDSSLGAGLAIRGEEVADSRPDIEAWLRTSRLLD